MNQIQPHLAVADSEISAGGRALPDVEVAEFQGLYGTYHVSEVLLQKIWLRGALDLTDARTTAGESLVVTHPGAWNRLSGPDFTGARLVVGGREVVGDVEVHFHAGAWKQHGHEVDPAYRRVVLHVVLFPPPPGIEPARTSDGHDIPTLVIVDRLWHDLEEYATDEAVAALSGRDSMPLVESLLSMDPETRAAAVHHAALLRWREKVRYARLRIERCGWEEACHLTALEILGYRSNREAMLRVATRFPWSRWGSVDRVGEPSIEDLIGAGGEAWTVRGVRPANQPRLRLEQYRRWMSRVPEWPRRLRARSLADIGSEIAGTSTAGVSGVRRRVGLAALRADLAQELTGGQLGGLRFDTFVVNLVLPFLAAVAAPESVAEAWWRLWTPGDIAEVLLEASRRLSLPAIRETRTNEVIQGLLGLHLQRTFGVGVQS